MAERTWTVPNNHDRLVDELVGVSYVLRNVGGTFTIAPYKVEVAPDVFETQHYVIHWDSFLPARRLPKESPAQDSDTYDADLDHAERADEDDAFYGEQQELEPEPALKSE